MAAAIVVGGVVGLLGGPSAPEVDDAVSASRWFDASFVGLAREYQAPRDVVAVAAVALRGGFALALAMSPPGRRVVGWIAARVGQRPWLTAVVVAGGAFVLIDVLLSPLAFWSGFVHAGDYGLRTQGVGGWLLDWLAFRAPTWVGAAVVAGLAYAVATRFPRGWPPVVAAGGAALLVGLVVAGPLVLEPLAYDTRPLEPGPARQAVQDVAAAGGVDVHKVLIADASKRTTRENAYISGLGATRRVVLFDTLVQARQPNTIRAVVAHELAHHQHRDILRGSLAAAAAVVVGVYALAAWLGARTRRGRQRAVSDPGAVGLVVGAVMLVSVLATPIEAAASRGMEAAADWRALQLLEEPGAFEQLQVQLARSNLNRPAPPVWRHVWWGTHPSPVERLAMAQRWRAMAGSPPAGAPRRAFVDEPKAACDTGSPNHAPARRPARSAGA
jgi:STE24 endopeptidase